MRCLAIVLAGAGVAVGALAAPIPQEDFTWRSSIRGALTNGDLYRIKVRADVLDGSRAFPVDVRIVDRDGNEWPFFVWKATPSGERSIFHVDLLDSVIENAPERHLRQDLRIAPPRSPLDTHGRVVITMAGADFVRRVQVLGSEDRAAWHPLGQGYLIDQRSNVRLSSAEIQYDPSRAPFLRLLIYPSPDKTGEVLRLQSADVFAVEDTSQVEAIPLKRTAVPPDDVKEGIQTLEYDLGFRNVPVTRLRVDAANAEFASPLKVFGRNTETNTWRWVADGGIHRMGGQSRNTVALRDATYRYLKLDIFRYEAEPLNVTNVVAETEPQFLVLEALGGARPRVYFGASTFSLPRYDLRRRTRDEDVAAAPVMELGSRERNPSRLARTLRSYAHWLGAMALTVLAILGAVVLVNWLRRSQAG